MISKRSPKLAAHGMYTFKINMFEFSKRWIIPFHRSSYSFVRNFHRKHSPTHPSALQRSRRFKDESKELGAKESRARTPGNLRRVRYRSRGWLEQALAGEQSARLPRFFRVVDTRRAFSATDQSPLFLPSVLLRIRLTFSCGHLLRRLP